MYPAQLLDRDERLCAMFREGKHSLQVVGDHFGLTRERVRQILKKNGITDRWKFTIENSGGADDVRRLYGDGYSFEDIAEQVGLPIATVVKIRKPRALQRKRRVNEFWRLASPTANPVRCWVWQGYTHPVSGYGIFNFGHERSTHRIAWSLANGRKPSLHVLHSCDNPPCVNPRHLREGTPLDNARDRDQRGRGLTGKSYRRLDRAAIESIRNLLKEGISQHEIAKEFGVGAMTINHINTGKTWAGEGGQGRYTLTNQQVLEVRRRVAEGEQLLAIANSFGIDPSVISRIKRGVTYRDPIFFL